MYDIEGCRIKFLSCNHKFTLVLIEDILIESLLAKSILAIAYTELQIAYQYTYVNIANREVLLRNNTVLC